MRLLKLSLLIALVHFTALTLATPLRTPPLAARNQFCANAPLTVAGTLLTRHSLPPPLHPRKSTDTVLWCAPHTRTYLILEMASSAAGSFPIKNLLVSAANMVAAQLHSGGDGAVREGLFYVDGVGDVSLWSQNSNNHQQTWGVVEAVVAALWDYMSQFGFGAATFAVFDGGREVGRGRIG